jgi:hypothetical protein
VITLTTTVHARFLDKDNRQPSFDAKKGLIQDLGSQIKPGQVMCEIQFSPFFPSLTVSTTEYKCLS